jgi:hypothetical protein
MRTGASFINEYCTRFVLVERNGCDTNTLPLAAPGTYCTSCAFVHRFSKVLRKLKSVYQATHRPVKGSRYT